MLEWPIGEISFSLDKVITGDKKEAGRDEKVTTREEITLRV